jgi:hypothetical protein
MHATLGMTKSAHKSQNALADANYTTLRHQLQKLRTLKTKTPPAFRPGAFSFSLS